MKNFFTASKTKLKRSEFTPTKFDSQIISTATQAAEADAKSGAYDEFIFTDHSFVEMPFERSVNKYLQLSSKRIASSAKMDIVAEIRKLLKARTRLSQATKNIEQLNLELEKVSKDKAKEQKVLSGEVSGKHGLDWSESMPMRGSFLVDAYKLATPVLIYLLVAFVDVGIIYVSFNNIPGMDGWEPIIFTLPAVAAQVVFPHFIGQRLLWIYKGHRNSRANRNEILILLGTWTGFIVTMVYVRLALMLPEVRIGIQNQEFPIQEAIIYLMNTLILIALGAWLILFESRSNPHLLGFQKLEFKQRVLERRISRANRQVLKAQSELESAQALMDLSESVAGDASSIAANELFSAVKENYRRALVNQFGNIEFTSNYLEREFKNSVEK